jgi:hypothetical protein
LDEPLDYISDTHVMRYLNGKAWDIDVAIQAMIAGEQLRVELNMEDSREDEF